MNLEQIYSTQIQKKRINTLQVGGSFPQIEKDPTIRNLENNVFSKMREIVGKDNPNISQVSKVSVKSVSFEEALKELQSMQKSN